MRKSEATGAPTGREARTILRFVISFMCNPPLLLFRRLNHWTPQGGYHCAGLASSELQERRPHSPRFRTPLQRHSGHPPLPPPVGKQPRVPWRTQVPEALHEASSLGACTVKLPAGRRRRICFMELFGNYAKHDESERHFRKFRRAIGLDSNPARRSLPMRRCMRTGVNPGSHRPQSVLCIRDHLHWIIALSLYPGLRYTNSAVDSRLRQCCVAELKPESLSAALYSRRLWAVPITCKGLGWLTWI